MNSLEREVDEAQEGGFDLDEVTEHGELSDPVRPPAPLDLDDIDVVIRRADLLPPGVEVGPLGHREYSYLTPGQGAPIRVTMDPAFYEAHSESVELWSPGSLVFPIVEGAIQVVDVTSISRLPLVSDGSCVVSSDIVHDPGHRINLDNLNCHD